MKITGKMLCDRMIKIDKSPRELAQEKCVSEADIKNWMSNGVPNNRNTLMSEFYKKEVKK